MTTTVIDLLDEIGAHLAGFEVPAPWSVSVARDRAHSVDIQLDCEGPERIAAALLAWADTLSEVTTAAWRCYDGQRVHLSITGKLPAGATTHVYGAIAYSGHGIGAELAPGEATSLRPRVLRALATPGQVSA